MSIKPTDVAAKLGVTKQAVNKFIRRGMPLGSMEEALAWYNSNAARRAPTDEKRISELGDDEFDKMVEQHASLKDEAYRAYSEDLQARDPNQSKSYATYDKLLKTSVFLERERQARLIASGQLIKATDAQEAMGKVLLSVRNELTQMAAKVAKDANPDNPRVAYKSIEDEVNRILSRVSGIPDDEQVA